MRNPDTSRPTARHRHGRAFSLSLAACLLAGTWASVQAHEASDHIPVQRGFQLNAAVAAHYLHADDPLPGRSLPGVLDMGNTPEDQRDGYLEHAVLSAGARLHPTLGASLGVGKHGNDPWHVENAWLEWRPRATAEWSIGAGRNRVPVGQVIDAGGHFDVFAQMPLAKRAVFEGDWVEDGLSLNWQPHRQGWLRPIERVDFGLWNARRFPGSDNASLAPVVRIRAHAGARVVLDGFASRIRAKERGSHIQRPEVGHSHTAPDCGVSLVQVTCFDGDVNLLGLSLDWRTPVPQVQAQAAALWRQEKGSLYGQSSTTDYRGRTRGGWLQLQWQPAPRWNLAVRHEWLKASHHLQGSGASLLAREAGLSPNHPARRSTAAIAWQPWQHWNISLEAGTERNSGQNNDFYGIRLRWQPEHLISRSI